MNILSNNTTTTFMPAVSRITSEPSEQNNIFITVNHAENKTLNTEIAALISVVGLALAGSVFILYRHLSNNDHRVFATEAQNSQHSLDVDVNGEDTRAADSHV